MSAIVLHHDRNSGKVTIDLLALTEHGKRRPTKEQLDWLAQRVAECAAITCGDLLGPLHAEPTDEFRIWWTSQSDCAAITDAPGDLKGVPSYVISQLRSRIGRNGRGRLWVHDTLPVRAMTCPDRAPVGCGGIVIRASDADRIRGLPGFVTDLAGHRV